MGRSANALLARFAALPFTDKLLLLRALAVLAWVRWVVARHGLAMVEARARRTATRAGSAANTEQAEDAQRVARLLHAAQRALPGRSTCLHLAAALKLLLAERRIASDLRIGVRKQSGEFQAHAWLDCAGRVLIGGCDAPERYAPFPASNGGSDRA